MHHILLLLILRIRLGVEVIPEGVEDDTMEVLFELLVVVLVDLHLLDEIIFWRLDFGLILRDPQMARRGIEGLRALKFFSVL